jgi:hypothetical protein
MSIINYKLNIITYVDMLIPIPLSTDLNSPNGKIDVSV